MKSALVLVLFATASPAESRPCVIVHAHQYKFGENAARFRPHKPLDYIEGAFPPRIKFQYELDNKAIQKIEGSGGKVVILKADYSLDELNDARRQCEAK